MAGLLRPTNGTVRVLGGEVSDPSVRRRVGVSAHMPALYPRLTAFENIRFWSAIYDDGDAPERGRDLLASLDLDPDDTRPVSAYSQGMRQRTSIARALCTDPDVVLADEPFAALDPSGAEKIAGLLNRVRTAIVATHDRGHFDATRRLAMHRGALQDA
jgi:ABC-type multidrug transport system ATPase subunit